MSGSLPPPPLHCRPLGSTGIEVSELGFGAGSYWGKQQFPEKRAVALVHQALELGINYFDTGPSYSGGNAEPRLGRALSTVHRDSLVISSKVGTSLGPNGRPYKNFQPATIRRQVEQSLRHLSLDRLPVLFVHGPTVEQLGPETRDCLENLQQRGLVHHLGLNSFDPPVIEYALDRGIFDCLMVDYNLLRQEREPIIEAWAEAGKGVIAASALARALVGNRLLKLRSRADLWYLARALATRRQDLVRGVEMSLACRGFGWTRSSIAVAFVLSNPRVSSAMVGTTNVSHLTANVRASGRPLPASLLERIRTARASPLEP